MDMEEKMLGGLWGAVVGDALGVPVEFTSRENRRKDPVTDMRGFGTHNQPPGTWSDDSSLLLCTVEQLCGKYDPHELGRLFVAWRDKGHWTPAGTVFDIGNATSSAISRLRTGISPEEAGVTGDRSIGNGSLMRILPVALKYHSVSDREMLSFAYRISSLTHRHPRCLIVCGLYCLMVSELLSGRPAKEAYKNMVSRSGECFTSEGHKEQRHHFARMLSGDIHSLPEDEIKSGGYAIHTLEASLWCLLNSQYYDETVFKAVNLGDDTDTTGCVAGGLAGILYGIELVPLEWRKILVRYEDINKLFSSFLGSIK